MIRSATVMIRPYILFVGVYAPVFRTPTRMLKVQVNERSTKFSALFNTDAFWNLRRSTCVFGKLIWVTWVLMSVLCITYMWVHSARFQISAAKSLITVNLHIGNTSTCADPHTHAHVPLTRRISCRIYTRIYKYIATSECVFFFLGINDE
jgi:hypothetical protein